MACGLQRLFGDLEDEDFLSAVEDAENRFLAPGAPSLSHGAPGAQPPQHRPGPALRPLAGGCRSPPAPRDAPGPGLLLEGPERGERRPRESGALKRPREGAGPGPPSAPQAAPRLGLRPSAAGTCPPAPPVPMGKPRGCIPAPAAPSPRPFQAPPHQAGTGSPPMEPRGPQPPQAPPCPSALQSPVVTNHLVQLVAAASKAPGAAPRPPAQGKTRRFPGPAGILPQQHAGKLLEEILISAPQIPCHGAMAKPQTEGMPSSSLPTEEDFGKGPWLTMKTELELDERDPGCFLRTYSVIMVLRKAALKQLPRNKVPSMAVMIRTLTRTNADAAAVFRDPTGEMQGTVHRLLLEERQSELRPGSVLLLRQVGVFSPSHRNHYLNVTPNNLLKIYPAEPEASFSQPSPARQEVPPHAPAHPTEPPRGVPAPGHWGGHSRPHGTEQAAGQEEPEGAGGYDVDDLDGLLGELPEDFFSAPAQADCC
ncbi:homologous recombination OB-fold protein [Pezoporus occidentalis]|uniref:homologous recombination OB-fold protein n=1 Tax=Pezoporus occidentalis TaxID=407982 RepID=UPI002F918A1C